MKDKKKEKHKQEETEAKPQGPESPPRGDAEAKKHELEQLRQQLSETQKQRDDLQKEKDELFGRLQRLSADYANFQKRVLKQIDDSIAHQKESIVKSLLPVLDNFESGMAGLQNAHGSQNTEALVNGVRIIYDQMLDVLRSHGVEQIKTLGEIFDPAVHEAVLRKTEQDKEDDTILEEYQKGYKLNGRVIRPGKVVVNKLEETPSPQEPADKAKAPDEADGEFETTDTQ